MNYLSEILKIWNILVESNTFNFILFLFFIGLILKKVNIAAIINLLQQKIIKILDEVQNDKEDAHNKFLQAEKAIENLPQELDGIISEAQKSAKVIGDKILNEAKKQVEIIELNAQKSIDAEEKLLISKLTKNTSNASIEAATSHIKNILIQTPTLHEKYINESIDELDRLNF